jgi:hypothetical protein
LGFTRLQGQFPILTKINCPLF